MIAFVYGLKSRVVLISADYFYFYLLGIWSPDKELTAAIAEVCGSQAILRLNERSGRRDALLLGSLIGTRYRVHANPSRMRNRRSQRLTLVVIKRFSLTCSRPFSPSCWAISGWVSK